jgi:gamma-glutamyl-gamma-aminobutyrate hydrolase PuuD
MKWLVTYPDDGPSVAYYARWLNEGGVEATLVSSDYAHPGNIENFDALLLPGGGDVDPQRYGDIRHAKTDGVNNVRDDLEVRLVAEFMDAAKPVFGICRGIQILNVALGGKLIQHVPDALGESSGEQHARKDSYDSRHALVIDVTTRLGSAVKEARDANSAHHQAIDPGCLGQGLRVVARSGAGVIEAVECFDRVAPLVAVQWHPEREPDPAHPTSQGLRDFLVSLVTASGH